TPGETQQIIVRALWSDGVVSDVTSVAVYDALNDSVAAVSPAGLITAKSPGETHVMIRFMGHATVVQVTLPYAKLAPEPGSSRSRFAPHNVIDEKLLAKWKELGLTPSELCDDADFFRRIHLDAI